jgi:hypothetical protein
MLGSVRHPSLGLTCLLESGLSAKLSLMLFRLLYEFAELIEPISCKLAVIFFRSFY